MPRLVPSSAIQHARLTLIVLTLAVWTTAIVVLTQAPFDYVLQWRFALRVPSRFGFGWGPSLLEPIANLVLFVPFGALLSIILRRREAWLGRGSHGNEERHTRGSRLRRLLIVLATGAAFSLLLESLQGLQPVRHPSFVDVILNAAGTGVGAWFIYVYDSRWLKPSRARRLARCPAGETR